MLRNNFKLLVLALVLTSLHITSIANAQGRPGRPGPGPGRPGFPREEVVERHIYQRFQGQNILNVSQALELDFRYYGRTVKSVILKMSSDVQGPGRPGPGRPGRPMPYGEAHLMVNRQSQGFSQRVDGYPRAYTFQLPFLGTLGRDVMSLEVLLRGNLSVETVAVVLTDDRGGGNDMGELVEERINQRVLGNANLPLRQILRLDQRYEGRRVESVVIVARSDFGRAQAVAVINGMAASRPEIIDNMSMRYVLPLTGDTTLGRSIRTLELNLRGNLMVESVGVQLSRFR